MQNKNQAPNEFNSLNVLYFIYKWRKVLGIVCLIAFLLSSIVSLTIKEKYKSTVILFPATTNSISKLIYSKQDDMLKFGEEEEGEQMLQILGSDEIRTRVCEKYYLMRHYGIDSSSKFKQTALLNQFQNNITFKRTEFGSVKIEVLDVDPELASVIANDIADLYDSTKIRIQRARLGKALEIVSGEYEVKNTYVNKLIDSIRILNSLGMFDYESQSEVTSEQYAIAIAKGDNRAIQSLEEKFKVISMYGSAYISIRDKLEMQQKQLNSLQTILEETKTDAEQIMPQKFVVSMAYPAEGKSYPIRWLIVLLSTVSSLILGVLVILAVENINQYKNKITRKV